MENIENIFLFTQSRWGLHREGIFPERKIGLGRGRLRDTRDPQNPDFGPAKKSSLPLHKMCKNVRFWAKKRAFSVNLCTILHKNDLFFADIAPRYRAASPSGKNPPIYTVLNAAFSAPGPPRLWHRGGTPVPDAFTQAPGAPFCQNVKNTFFQNTMMSDRKSPITLLNLNQFNNIIRKMSKEASYLHHRFFAKTRFSCFWQKGCREPVGGRRELVSHHGATGGGGPEAENAAFSTV